MRLITIFDKIGFISGSLSCPEIARLCLSKRDLKIKTLTNLDYIELPFELMNGIIAPNKNLKFKLIVNKN